MTFKLTIIGAGSVGFTKKLCQDILKVPEFEDIEIALTDINAHNLDMVAQIIRAHRRGERPEDAASPPRPTAARRWKARGT